jgi:hypothetical protein
MADVVLDYNQIIEETPVTGDSIPSSGGLITFQFKCDVNGATDLSNTFFAADLNVMSLDVDGSTTRQYIPDGYDFHAFPMLRCFNSITHIIDGQTVCNSQHPYADALIVEKFLTTHSKANIENFQALSLCKQIDNGMKEFNIFSFDKPATVAPSSVSGGWKAYVYDWAKPGIFSSKYNQNGTTAYVAATGIYDEAQGARENISDSCVTMLFQPPFDLWRLRQPFHGGIHQIQFNLKPRETGTYWGGYMSTSCVGLSVKGGLLYDMPRGIIGNSGSPVCRSSFGPMAGLPVTQDGGFDISSMSYLSHTNDAFPDAAQLEANANAILTGLKATAEKVDSIFVDIKRIRLLRRVLRTAVPPQLSNVQYNFTEISMQHGTPTSDSMSQQFLLPSTTFGLIFYWRESTNTYYDQVGVHPTIERITSSMTGYDSAFLASGTIVKMIDEDSAASVATVATGTDITNEGLYRTKNLDFDLHDFQFTYGGATYPMQRIQRISGNKDHNDASNPYGWHRMMTLQNQLQGVFNSTMDDFPHSYGHGYGKGVLNRMDPHMMFFPVSRTGNSDNGILQVEYNCSTRKPSSTSLSAAATTGKDVQLCVVALYDAQLNMQYSSNELQQIVLTQFK